MAFDLDGTLSVSKSPIDARMASLLTQLLSRVEVCVISGGAFAQFQTQVLRLLHEAGDGLTHLHIMPTCGTRYYRWRNTGWYQVYAEDLSPADRARIIGVLTSAAKTLGLWQDQPDGDIIEDRGSQITFSALGQAAAVEAKYAWDADGRKRQRIVAYAAQRLPGFEVRSGGSTSVDVTAKGIDKAYGMRKLIEYLHIGMADVIFVGDRLDENGNDYPVKEMGIRCASVTKWQDTADYIENFLTSAR